MPEHSLTSPTGEVYRLVRNSPGHSIHRWAIVRDRDSWVFEGAPTIAAGRVWVEGGYAERWIAANHPDRITPH